MKKRKLTFERLEDRTVPALLLQLDGSGNLTGIFGNAWDDVELEFTGADAVEVLENGNSLGIYSVPGNLTVALGNTAAATPTFTVDFATNAGSMSGSLGVTLGNTTANTVVAITGGAAIDEIGGNFNFRSGAGDSINTITDVDVAGSTYFDPGAGGDGITMTGSDIGGSLALANAGASYDSGTVGGNLTFRGNDGLFNSLTLGGTGVVSGSLIFTGQRTAATFLDVNGDVLGDLIMSTGIAGGTLDMTTAGSSVLGNVRFTGGNGNDFVNISTVVGGSVTASLGSGDDLVNLNAGATILGNAVTIIGGNGDDVVTVGAIIAPGVRMTYLGGNGDDTLNFDATTVLASLYYDGGFGTDAFNPTGVIAFPTTIRNVP